MTNRRWIVLLTGIILGYAVAVWGAETKTEWEARTAKTSLLVASLKCPNGRPLHVKVKPDVRIWCPGPK